jgi:hypothetical protein
MQMVANNYPSQRLFEGSSGNPGIENGEPSDGSRAASDEVERSMEVTYRFSLWTFLKYVATADDWIPKLAKAYIGENPVENIVKYFLINGINPGEVSAYLLECAGDVKDETDAAFQETYNECLDRVKKSAKIAKIAINKKSVFEILSILDAAGAHRKLMSAEATAMEFEEVAGQLGYGMFVYINGLIRFSTATQLSPGNSTDLTPEIIEALDSWRQSQQEVVGLLTKVASALLEDALYT